TQWNQQHQACQRQHRSQIAERRDLLYGARVDERVGGDGASRQQGEPDRDELAATPASERDDGKSYCQGRRTGEREDAGRLGQHDPRAQSDKEWRGSAREWIGEAKGATLVGARQKDGIGGFGERRKNDEWPDLPRRKEDRAWQENKPRDEAGDNH